MAEIKAKVFICNKRKGFAIAKPEEKSFLQRFGDIFIPLPYGLETGESINEGDRVFLTPIENTRRREQKQKAPGDKGYCAKDKSVRRLRV